MRRNSPRSQRNRLNNRFTQIGLLLDNVGNGCGVSDMLFDLLFLALFHVVSRESVSIATLSRRPFGCNRVKDISPLFVGM